MGVQTEGRTVLSIAGYDPSSGAGVTADVKTCAAHGCFATTCITALTVQSTRGVRRVVPVSPDVVADTLAEVADDLPPDAVRVGMLGSGAVARVVAEFLERTALPNIVVDPVIVSSSGRRLIDDGGLAILRERILPIATVVTPNVDEAALLTGIHVGDDASRRDAGERLLGLGSLAAVVTGGHLESAKDLMVYRDEHGEIVEEVFGSGEKIASGSTHGTGCAFATSVACSLALGKDIPEAVRLAKHYVTEAIRHARAMGHGTGPVEHLWKVKF